MGAAGRALVAAAAFALARHPAHRQRPQGPVEGLVIPRSFVSPRDEESAGPPADPSHADSSERARGDIRLATSAALVAGAVSLASEIVWTRALVFFVHNSTYAFSAIVAVYLLGIAAGALVAARFARTRTSALRSLAVTLGASSAALLVAILVYRHLPELAALLASGPPPAPATPERPPSLRCRCGAGGEHSPSSSGRWRPCSSCRRSSWAPSSRSRSSSPRRATGRRGWWDASTPSTRSAVSPAQCWARSFSWPSSARGGRCCSSRGSRCRSPSGPCARRSRTDRRARRSRGSSSRPWPAAACWPLPAGSTRTSSRRGSAVSSGSRRASPRPWPSASTRTEAGGSSFRTGEAPRARGPSRAAGSTRTCRSCCTPVPGRRPSSASAPATPSGPRVSTPSRHSTGSSFRPRSSRRRLSSRRRTTTWPPATGPGS